MESRNEAECVRQAQQDTPPTLLIVDARIDTDGKVRLQLESETLAPYLSVSTNDANNLHWGAGLTLTY
ncbi:MAG: hypothetical protein K1W09_01530 [Akkermansia muciniphila]|uniref:hypothetical protein n=1 Tax=uncultured Akkermansia sp. TaxID=512294 RepID=UPI0026110790|nr:hypothetical protein [uncultured Akkermansia sp.]